MKKILITLSVFASFLFINNEAKSQSNTKASIEQLIFSYRDALNASDANKVIGLYAANAVFLPANAPTATGTDQIKGTYQYLFDNFKFNLEFTIAEVVVNGNYAFARSSSQGTMTPKAGGEAQQGENRELFVFQKVAGNWKIARYMFNQPK